MKTTSHTLIFLILSILLFCSLSHTKDLSIIVNKSNKTTTLEQLEIKRIFTGKKRSWKNKSKIMVIVYKKGKLHSQFLEQYIQKNPTQFAILWKKLIFTGQAPLFKYVSNESEMIEHIKKNNNAVGYIFKENVNREIKNLFIKTK